MATVSVTTTAGKVWEAAWVRFVIRVSDGVVETGTL